MNNEFATKHKQGTDNLIKKLARNKDPNNEDNEKEENH